jgi:hypothetical protein
MDNVLETNGVPLTVFGGAVPELAPEDLPEGASPFNQDCDYNPGSVFTRGGRVNQFYYSNLFYDNITQFARNQPGAFAPNEVAWTTPQNAQLNTPPQYAFTQLNQGVNISNLLQYRQVMVNTSGTTFTAAFNAPVTAGSCVFIALFIHDPNGSVEGINCTACIDNKAQTADHIVANVTSPNNNNCAFALLYKSAVGGNQTYTFTLQTNAAGTLTASTYSYCLCEVIGTANTGGADPSDQLFSVTVNLNSTAQSSGNTVTTAQPNELFLGVVQATDATWNGFFMPGVYWNAVGPATMRIINEIDSASGNFQAQALVGENIPSNPGTTLGITNTGPTTGVDWYAAWVTLKMTNTNAVGKNGILPLGVDAVNTSITGGIGSIPLPQLTTNLANEFIFYVTAYTNNFGYPTVVPPVGYVGSATIGGQGAVYGLFAATPGTYGPFSSAIPGGNTSPCVSAAFSIPTIGIGAPNVLQGSGTGSIPNGTTNLGWTRAVQPGSTIIVFGAVGFANPFAGFSVTDSVGDSFVGVTTVGAPNGLGSNVGLQVYICQNAVGGNTDISIHSGVSQGGTVQALEFAPGAFAIQPTPHSEILAASNFGFAIPSTAPVLGMEIELSGHQSTLDPSATISVTTNQPGSSVITTQLPGSDSQLVIGTPLSNFGLALTPAMLNNNSFTVQIVANESNLTTAATFNLYAVKVRVFVAPSPPANFDWIKTYQQTDGEIDTLALDANGILWDEDVDTNPGVLNSIFTTILKNTYAKSVTFDDIEYIAFSNLVNGTDVPRQWNGTNLDRISMVGPGAAPSASSAGSGSNTFAIQNTTQQPATEIRRIAWGTVNSPADSTPGNLLVVYGEGRTGSNTYQSLPPYTPTFGSGTHVVLSGVTNPFPKKDGGTLPYNINGNYIVGTVQTGIVGGAESCPTFTLPSPTTTWAYSADFGSGGPPPTSNWFYQSCIATVTMQVGLPNVGPGSQITISGTGGSPPSGYDGTWTVLQAPNAVQMTINSTQLNSATSTATYSFTLLPGFTTPPQVNQIVTITNCENGGSPSPFNGTFTIASVSGGQFTVSIPHPTDISLQTETGEIPTPTAVVAGTIFSFDAGVIVNSGNPVAGGTITQQGQIATGPRKVCYSFLTRSGYITQPSPIAQTNITTSAGSVSVSGLATGPPNVVARIVMFTGANGGNFFYIPQPVLVTVGGVTTKNDATIVNDNTSTTATFSFSDAVLLSATAVDIVGNNLFNDIELGSCRGIVTYAERLFAWSEQNKVTNLRNWSFDGGAGGTTISGATTSYPLGWTLDSTNGSGGSLLTSSTVFGWCYQIQNTSGSTQATYGMLTQPAWHDEFGVAIIQPSAGYSVRITASVNPVPASGNLIVDLFSPSFGTLGTFSLPLASMTTSMQIYSGTLLTTPLAPVPPDLVIRIWAQNILNNTTIVIDRVEPFVTFNPVLSTAFKASYANNQEAFDQVTGVCGPAQNSQPINGGAVLFDLLYALKEKSWYSTSDNGVTEPFQWNWKTVSDKVGAVGIHSYDYGEGWMVTANRQGGYFFEGGEPIKITQEIQPLWDLINWQYGYTIWMRNDPEQKRMTIGVPIATPNAYMPEFPPNANPTSPNVILMCNYRELNTGAALAQTGPIRSTYMGRLMSPEPARKWSFWNISCPYSDFISRASNQWPQFYCTGYSNSKIFALLASSLGDDGNAINSFWISYGFVKPEAADAKGLGLFRMEFPYFTVLAIGSGTLNSYVYPESPFNRPYVLDPTPLPAITQGDLEIGVNIKGQRFFVRVGTNQVGQNFRCSKMVVPLLQDSWSPVRGFNAISA